MAMPSANRDPQLGLEAGVARESAVERSSFSEKAFYLQEFHGRTLGILLSDREQATDPGLLAVLDELRANATRVVLVVAPGVALEPLACEVLAASEDRLEGRAWRALRRGGRVALVAGGDVFATFLDVARRLGLFKVIRLAAVAGYQDSEGRRRPFIDLAELRQLLAGGEPDHAGLLREVVQLLEAGVLNVNLCTATGLHDELFTYSGSGTLFTRERHVTVRALGVDDYDAADDLIARGVAEGYLVARPEDVVDRLLADGFGAFVEGHHLAGIGALRISAEGHAGEVASLYALTRFLREGIGGQLVRYAIERARALELAYVYACSTSERAGEFFRRHSFVEVEQSQIPADKWLDYDEERRQRVTCYRRDLAPT